ncbi:MAG: glucokinase [Spiribacter sp.]|jgi:glucokinase|nr:glucokinase [Spiribacter sp.]MDR9489659.1 glucokinase [Spiribacter sp.]
MSTGRPKSKSWLIADIGGTRARVGEVLEASTEWHFVGEWETAPFRDLADFLSTLGRRSDISPTHVICAIASPIRGDEVALTNAGWRFSIEQTRKALGLNELIIINDWVAQGWAVAHAPDHALTPIQLGEPMPQTPKLALGPGTGLGSALITPKPDGWQVFATEGGHMSFAANNARETAIVARIQARWGHCSGERLASGSGLANLYSVLGEIDGRNLDPLDAKAVSSAAQANDPTAIEAIRLMTAALGSLAGDLALASGARGGIYLGGGLIGALAKQFDESVFLERFSAKGRFREYLLAIPIYRMTLKNAALYGLTVGLDAIRHQSRMN